MLPRSVLFIGCLLLSASGERSAVRAQGGAKPAPTPQWIWSSPAPALSYVPKARQGSWISMTIDDAGRMVAYALAGGAPGSERFAK